MARIEYSDPAKANDRKFIGDLQLAGARLLENAQREQVGAAENGLRIEALVEQGSDPLPSELQR